MRATSRSLSRPIRESERGISKSSRNRSIEAASAASLDDLAAAYRHQTPSDFARIRLHEHCATDAEALKALLQIAIKEIERRGEKGIVQLVEVDGKWRFADGVTFDDLRWQRQKITRPAPDIHAQLGDPCNPRTGWMADISGPPAKTTLRERGVVIVGHRRLAVAKELGITPVIKTISFGEGDAADARRVRLALASNLGGKPLSKQDRQKIRRASLCRSRLDDQGHRPGARCPPNGDRR